MDESRIYAKEQYCKWSAKGMNQSFIFVMQLLQNKTAVFQGLHLHSLHTAVPPSYNDAEVG